MTRTLSLMISRTTTALLVVLPVVALYFLFDIDAFAAFTRNSIGLPIQWNTVVSWQWYFLWAVTALYLSVGLLALYFLRRPFARFADGEMFNLENSRDLQRFAGLLLAQGLLGPVQNAVSSVILSANHPAGMKMLSISLGSNELKLVGVAAIVWVMSRLLIEGYDLQSENRQFV